MSYHILILDDDQSFLEEAKRSLSNFFVQCKLVCFQDTTSAQNYIGRHSDLDLIIVDCLLPGISGVDFVKSQGLSNRMTVYLVSGVFTDSQFAESACIETKAHAFFLKPISWHQLASKIQKEIVPKSATVMEKIQDVGSNSKSDSEVTSVLYTIFDSKIRDARGLRKVLESIELVHGFDLPLVYVLLFDSNLSGYLNLQKLSTQEIYGVTFGRGKVYQIDLGDESSYLGRILVDRGELHPDDLQLALNLKSEKRIGEYLVDNFLVSPHALQSAIQEQLSIRMSKTIMDENYSFNFVPANVGSSDIFVTEEILLRYVHDWVLAKLPVNWILKRFAPWWYHILEFTSVGTYKLDKLKDKELVQRNKSLLEELPAGIALSNALSKGSEIEMNLKGLFYMLTVGVIYFRKENLSQNHKAITCLMKVLGTIDNGSNFDKSLFPLNFSSSQFQRDWIYQWLQGFMDVDDLDLKNKIKLACDKLKGFSGESESSAKEGVDGKNQMVFSIIRSFEEGKQMLLAGKIGEAFQLLKEAASHDLPIPGLMLHYLWAKILTGPLNNQSLQNFELEIQTGMLKIPPEERHDALYHYVVGLSHKTVGRKNEALRAFEKAINLDKSFVLAKKEILALKSSVYPERVNTPKDGSQSRSLFSQLFKKR